MLLLAMITCFMSIGDQNCCVGGSLWFLFDSYALPLYQTLLLIITMSLVVAEHACLEFAHIPYSADTRLFSSPPSACRLESLGTRLIYSECVWCSVSSVCS